MLWGMPWGGRWGRPEDMITTLELANLGPVIRVRFQYASGFAQFTRLDVDGTPGNDPFFAPDDSITEILTPFDTSQTLHNISIVPLGDSADSSIDISWQQNLWESTRSNRLKVNVTPVPDYFSYGDSGQLTSWSLTGVSRNDNVKPYLFRPTWGITQLTLTNTAGTRTVTLLIDGTPVASGSRVGNGSITLSAVNSSGLTGSVTVTYTGDVTSNAFVVARFPATYPVYWKTTPFTAPDFPRTADGTITDDGHSNLFVLRTGALAAGTYYVLPHQKDDAANESTNLDGGGQTGTVVLVPAAPGTAVYTSGAAAATVISFAASATPAATYRGYDSGITGQLDLNTISFTHIAGTGTLTQTLAGISVGFTGTRLIMIRAVSGGVEEGNVQLLRIEYLAGVVVLPRPPAPGISAKVTVSGRTLTVPVSVNINEVLGTPTTVALFLFAVGGSPNYASPDGTASLGTAVASIRSVAVSATAGADVLRMYAVRTVTAGGVQSSNTDTYGPVKLTTTVPAGPTSTVEVGY